ncbi:Bardet-Biedl syndrome 12 protein [Bombina bombina]|uniref:Bardet-Biedl syndrome 12 protein n=1 Tax=Bombina bombina TaxID=8345 RepID=UPI00235B01F4|nr:Bardet-Biedl syndrome 12 protein [Bombina bombina]
MRLREHKGLQQLSTLTNSVKSFLGPVKSYKFIFDQSTNESTLTCSSFHLLESLDLTSSVGQLLNETVQAHQKRYKTGTTTLLLLAGCWSSSVLECLQQGIPTSLIATLLIEGLNSCIEQVQHLLVPLENVSITRGCVAERSFATGHIHCVSLCEHTSKCEYHCEDQDSKNKTVSKCNNSFLNSKGPGGLHQPSGTHFKIQSNLKKKLTHSRHFYVSERTFCQDFSQKTEADSSSSHTLENVARSLSHGSQNVMNLVKSAFYHFVENANETSVTKSHIHVSRLYTCCLPGLSEEYCNASFGFTTLVPPENAAVSNYLKGKSLQVLLLDGSLTESYRHMGFNCSTNLKIVSDPFSVKSKREESWVSGTFSKIIQANVNLILLKGDICPILMNQCIHRNILTVSHVPQNVLEAFSESTRAIPVTYLTQLSQCCIGSGAFVSICTKGSTVIEVGQRIAININARKMNLITVILSSRIGSKMHIIEDQFWSSAYRIHHALQEKKVFHGGGAVEVLCLAHLRKLEEECIQKESPTEAAMFPTMSSWMVNASIHYKAYIFKCLAKGWYKYLSILFCNIGEYTSELEAMTFIQKELQNISCSSSPSQYILREYNKKILLIDSYTKGGVEPVYDNVTPKIEAWRRALHLVLAVLQTDVEIITVSSA